MAVEMTQERWGVIRCSLRKFSEENGLVLGVFLIGILRMRLGEDLVNDNLWHTRLKRLKKECNISLTELRAYYDFNWEWKS